VWLWLYRGVFDYLAIIFSREDFRTNQILLLGILLLIAQRVRRQCPRLALNSRPHAYPPALLLLLGGSALYLLVERFLDINTISASLFGLAGYGLLGLWISPRAWKAGLPAALLLVGVLPFGDHIQTFIGYPVRLLTAAMVRDGLAAAGVHSIGVDTILVFENGVSQVDLPCSGVKSLWTGALFLLAATWVERRLLNGRWLAIAGAMGALLLATNLARVATLVIIGQVLGWRLAAEMLHVPLGVLAFCAACAAAVWLLRLGQHETARKEETPLLLPRPVWLRPLVALAMFALGMAYAARPPGVLAAPPDWEFPVALKLQPLPLTPQEIDWFNRDGAASVDRRRFEWRGLTGSMILITSSTWRAQHRPERCFEVYGLALNDSRTILVAPDFGVRFVSLGGGRGPRLSASYWFQSATRATDDFGTRLWADLAPRRERWVLVSILFDRELDPQAAESQSFYRALYDAVRRNLNGEALP
jgi:exosortase O